MTLDRASYFASCLRSISTLHRRDLLATLAKNATFVKNGEAPLFCGRLAEMGRLLLLVQTCPGAACRKSWCTTVVRRHVKAKVAAGNPCKIDDRIRRRVSSRRLRKNLSAQRCPASAGKIIGTTGHRQNRRIGRYIGIRCLKASIENLHGHSRHRVLPDPCARHPDRPRVMPRESARQRSRPVFANRLAKLSCVSMCLDRPGHQRSVRTR